MCGLRNSVICFRGFRKKVTNILFYLEINSVPKTLIWNRNLTIKLFSKKYFHI